MADKNLTQLQNSQCWEPGSYGRLKSIVTYTSYIIPNLAHFSSQIPAALSSQNDLMAHSGIPHFLKVVNSCSKLII